jgi:hypothetical protein
VDLQEYREQCEEYLALQTVTFLGTLGCSFLIFDYIYIGKIKFAIINKSSFNKYTRSNKNTQSKSEDMLLLRSQ